MQKFINKINKHDIDINQLIDAHTKELEGKINYINKKNIKLLKQYEVDFILLVTKILTNNFKKFYKIFDKMLQYYSLMKVFRDELSNDKNGLLQHSFDIKYRNIDKAKRYTRHFERLDIFNDELINFTKLQDLIYRSIATIHTLSKLYEYDFTKDENETHGQIGFQLFNSGNLPGFEISATGEQVLFIDNTIKEETPKEETSKKINKEWTRLPKPTIDNKRYKFIQKQTKSSIDKFTINKKTAEDLFRNVDIFEKNLRNIYKKISELNTLTLQFKKFDQTFMKMVISNTLAIKNCECTTSCNFQRKGAKYESWCYFDDKNKECKAMEKTKHIDYRSRNCNPFDKYGSRMGSVTPVTTSIVAYHAGPEHNSVYVKKQKGKDNIYKLGSPEGTDYISDIKQKFCIKKYEELSTELDFSDMTISCKGEGVEITKYVKVRSEKMNKIFENNITKLNKPYIPELTNSYINDDSIKQMELPKKKNKKTGGKKNKKMKKKN